ncbi:TIGR04197 family type VII secretion effector [Macrococcus capreoli]
MTKISVGVSKLTGNAKELQTQGANIRLDNLKQNLSNTDIDPFKGFEQIVLELKEAVKNYGDIVTKDACAVQHVIDEFQKKDKEIANKINSNAK